MRMLLFLVAALGTLVVPAGADEYWIAYEGNDFPEYEGWHRISYGEPQRWIEDGALVIDTLESVSWVDFYRWYLNGTLDPDPAEHFIMQWRMRINELIGSRDPGVGVRADTKQAVGFSFDNDSIWSVFEDDVEADFEPGVFHEFEFRSADMLFYELYIDGELRIEGSFWLSLDSSRVGWGDTVQGGASQVEWDYVRFGVIPEPTTGVLFLLAACGTVHACCRHRDRQSVQ